MFDLNMRVLVVDDFATMRKIVKNVLRQLGFNKIEEADDGATALPILKERNIDLVIADWNMPKMQGIDLLRAVRGDSELRNLPFIMVTAEGRKDQVLEAIKAGVSNYVVKPFKPETLREKIEKVFAQRK